MKDFANKVAAITGAASGIGRALALDLASRGCHLALCDVRLDELRQTAELVAPHGVRATHAEVDVADRVAMYSWAEQVARDHGGVNLIFNNAGVSVASTVHGLDYADLEWIMGINFWGVVHGTKAYLPHLKASGDGHVVNISSLFGLIAYPGQSAYNASKFAVRGFTEALRQELELLRWPVSATCVHPGGIKTNILRSIRYSPSMDELGLSSGARDAVTGFEKIFITPAEAAARKILRAVTRNKRRVLIGRDARFYDRLQRLLPRGYQRLVVSALRRRAAKRR
jgi:NAD(P)-dependent dehydrogenase (short-subunit alcohol dehydrogenase family)